MYVGDQNRETANQVRELRATIDATISQTRDLERTYYFRHQLIKDLVTTRAKEKERQDRHSTLEDRVVVAERRSAELQDVSTLFQAPPGMYYRERSSCYSQGLVD